jgi:hypothetical protein
MDTCINNITGKPKPAGGIAVRSDSLGSVERAAQVVHLV